MNTAETLEAITDRGQFELLVTSVLRKWGRDYAAIIHTGINAQGEPVKSPVDGFCLVPRSDPPRFILVQHTTTDRNELEKKWLYDHTTTKGTKSVSASSDGDLVKAAREAKELRKRVPGAEFIVILTTNQRPSEGLIKKVYEKAKEFKITVDIWEQSRITDFLDSVPEGHWLRRQFLGIEAEMLSESLLRSLCEQSLVRYEKELLLTNHNSWVPRKIDDRVQEGILSNIYTIQFLVGESGFGKSIAAYRALQKHLASGGYGLWAPAELIKECMSLENAINKVLRALYPHLLPDAGKTALQLIQEGSRFLIVVDDVNRADAPTKLVHKILTWSKPQQLSTPDSQPSFSPYLIVCPVWPHVWGVMSYEFSKASWVHTVFIGPMTSAEGALAVRVAASQAGIEITSKETNALTTKMGNDPVLIGLFGSLLPNQKLLDLNILAEDVIEKFITSCVKEAASALGASYLSIDFREALSTISLHMLRKRRLHPFWREIESWLEEDSNMKALRELIRHGKLCRLTDQENFVFRHDRIQETLLVESMITILADSTPDPDILEEPFYAEIIGRALVHSPQNQEFLSEMQNRNPLALMEAIRCFGTPTSDFHKAIIEEAKKWVKNSVATGSVPGSVLDAMCWSLVEIDSPAVLEITQMFPQRPMVLLARLRNGCTKSGARYCSIQSDFAPMINDSLRDQVIDHAKRRYGKQLLRELKRLLRSSAATDQERKGTLALAGFLGFTDIEDEIATCWKLVIDKIQVLPEAIWAAIQCCGAKPNKLLDPLMAYWAGLSDEEDSQGMSLKGHIVEALRFALARGIRDDVINYFIEQCKIHESLRWPITCMCDRIDAPAAIEFIVRSAADIKRRIAGTDRFSLWTAILTNNWNGSRRGGRRLSQASLARLKTLWEDPKNDDFVKQQAFHLWLTGAEWEQIDILRAIPTNSLLFRSALRKRTQLGDYSVVPDLLPLLSTQAGCFWFAHNVWCDKIMFMAQRHLETFKDNIPADFSGGQLNDHWVFSRLLTMIPVKDAETLLDKYWGHLGYSPDFIQTALYVGTSRCLELADSSISRCPKGVDILKHIHFQFGFMDHERQKYLTRQHFDNLLPYLDRLGEHELWEFAEVCQRLEIPEWSQRHLSNRLGEKYRKHYHPTDDDLLQDLDEFAEDIHGVWRVKFWLEEFDKRHEPRNRALGILDRWLAFHPTIEGLKIAAACVQAIGTRKDLSILDKYTIEGPPDEITNTKASARFFVYRRSLD